MSSKTYDTTPKPRMLLGLQRQKWNIAGALAELIDNSLGESRGNASKVTVIYNSDARTIDVLDNGRGMNAVGDLFRLGEGVGMTVNDIGIYGNGGTLALLWLGFQVSVITLRDGKVQRVNMHWPTVFKAERFPLVNNEWHAANLSNTPAELLTLKQGTLICMKLLRQRRFQSAATVRDLSERYAPAARGGKVLQWKTIRRNVEETMEIGVPAETVVPTKDVSFEVEIEVDGTKLRANGYAGIYPDLPQYASKIAIGYGYRVIQRTTDAYFNHKTGENYTGLGVKGWIDLHDGWQPYLSLAKDAIDDDEARDALMQATFEQIKPLLEEVEDQETVLVFNDIRLELEQAINAPVSVDKSKTSTATEGDGDLHLLGRGDESVDPNPNPNPNVVTDRRGQEDSDGKEKAAKGETVESTITIHHASDEAMQGVLCQAEANASGRIQVYVNKDHPFIREALVARPVNRLALVGTVTREIAQAILPFENLIKKAFGPNVMAKMNDLKGGDDTKARFLARQFIDKSRNLYNGEEAA